MPDVGQELLNVPFAEMVQKLALAIAEGQTKLDLNSTAVAQLMAGTSIKLPSIAAPTDRSQDIDLPLIALGFFPGYYQFQESIIEVKMAITMARTQETGLNVSAKAGWGPFSASVNASYSSKYSYNVEGSSLIRTKIVPVPPPAILRDYMEQVMETMASEAGIGPQNGGSDNGGGGGGDED